MVDQTLGRLVVRREAGHPSVRLLEVDGHAYGAVDLDDPRRFELMYLALFGAVVEALLPAGPCDLLHLGGGAFALPRALAARRPELGQVVVESSAAVIELAERELGLAPLPRLAVHHDDARRVVQRSATSSVDLIVGDAFVGRRTPRHLATAEFAAEVAGVLRPRGAYVLNVIDEPPWSHVGVHAATLRTAFPHLLAVGPPAVADLRESGNMLLISSRRPLHRGTLQWRLRGAPLSIDVLSSARLAALAAVAVPLHDG
ncbi:MAG TPA: fused MFS/spermidine synthase [Euzebyales bacterium]